VEQCELKVVRCIGKNGGHNAMTVKEKLDNRFSPAATVVASECSAGDERVRSWCNEFIGQ
jgi:hypothetical protein